MKFQKSVATCAMVASALVLAGCSAGQITQTSDQVAAVNGESTTQDNVALRDVAVVVGPKEKVFLKFTAGNVEEKGATVTLSGVKVDGAPVTLEGTAEATPGCNLVGDRKEDIQKFASDAKKICTKFVATAVDNKKDLFLGGHVPVEFAFNTGTITVDAPVVGYTPLEAGQIYRDPAAELVDEKTYYSETDPHAGHGAAAGHGEAATHGEGTGH